MAADPGVDVRVPLQDHLNLQRVIAEVEINIAPLQDNTFTNCKSELKFFEAAAVGTRTVATPTFTFRRAIRDGETGRLARTHEWDEALAEGVILLRDPERYAPIAEAAAVYDAYGWDPNEPANYMREAVREVGGNLSGLLYPWSWEQWHGSMVEHGGQARILADHIASLGLGFSIRQSCDVFDGFGRAFNVANGSFEDIARGGFGAFGWRYFDDGVERIRNP